MSAVAAPVVTHQYWWQRLLAVHPGRIPWWGGVRAAMGFGVPLATGVVVGELVLGMVGGLGGYFVVASDIGGAFKGRGATIVVTLLLSAAALVVGGIAFQSAWVAAPVLLVAGALAGTAALAGMAPAVAGTSALVTLVVAYGLPLGPTEGLKNAGALLTGGMVALVLTLMLWRRSRDRPARTAVAAVYDSLAALVDTALSPEEPASATNDPAPDGALTVPAALSSARAVLADSRLGDAGGGAEAIRALVGMQVAAHVFPALVALREPAARVIAPTPASDQSEPNPSASVVQLVGALLNNLSDGLRRVGHEFLMGKDPAPELERSLAIGRRLAASLLVLDEAGTQPLVRAYDLIEEKFGLLVGGETDPDDDEAPAARDQQVEVRLPAAVPPVGALLRSSFSWQSSAARHGLRLGLALVAGVVLNTLFGVKHPAWILITIVVVLKPDFGSTWQSAGQRLFGTLLGAVGAAAFIAADPGNVVILVALTPLIGLMYALQRFSAVVFTTLLSFFVLITGSLARPGDWTAAPERLLATGIGAVVAVVAILAVSPRDPVEGFNRALAAALQGNAAYLRTIVAGAPGTERTAAGLTAARAAGNGVVALGQLRAEPPRHGDEVDDRSLVLVLDQQILRTSLALDTMMSASAGDGSSLPGEVEAAAEKLDLLGADVASRADPDVEVARLPRERTIVADTTETGAMQPDSDLAPSRPLAAIIDRLTDQVDSLEGALRAAGRP